MATIKNVQPLGAEKLFGLLKTEFADYINAKLGSNLAIEYAHVFDEINVLFTEITEKPVLNITVSDTELTVFLLTTDTDYNIALLEQHLVSFLEEQAG